MAVKTGRPNAYINKIKPHLRQIAILRNAGCEHEDIISMLGIAQSTYYKYKAEIEEFMEALKKSDDGLVNEMEASLYDLALGRAKTTKVEYKYDEAGNEIASKKTVESLAPNQVALFFGLTNLSKGKWKHRQEVEQTFNEEDMKRVESFSERFQRILEERNNETDNG